MLKAGAAAGLMVALPTTSTARAGTGVGHDWPQSSRTRDGHRCTVDAVAGTTPRWVIPVPGGVPGAPAVVDGVVYAAGNGGDVVAVDLASGSQRWRTTLPVATYGNLVAGQGPRCLGFNGGPAVADGVVYVASDRVHALSAASGASVWRAVPLGSDDYFWAAPCLAGDLLILGSGSGSESAPTRGRVSAYDRLTGALRWSTLTVPAGGNGGGVICPVSVDLRRGWVHALTGAPYTTVAGSNPGTCSFVTLDLTTGAVLWQDQVHPGDTEGLDLSGTPVLIGRLAVGTAKDGVYAWDRLRRQRLWHTQLTPTEVSSQTGAGPEDGPEGGPIASDGRSVYVASNDATKGTCVVAALDPGTGKVLWQQRIPAIVVAAPALAAGVVWVASAAGLVHGLSTADGSTVGIGALGSPSAGAVSASGGSVLVGTGDQPYIPGDALACLSAPA